MRKRFDIGLAMAAIVASWSTAHAEVRREMPKRHHRALPQQIEPSEDAMTLSLLAPSSPYATQKQTYGDATFARARQQRRMAREFGEARGAPLGIYQCEPRAMEAAGYVCGDDPAHPEYGNDYAYLPAAASAPQVPRGDSSAQSAILPPSTALFWAVNSLRFDPRN